eukprot:1689524-Prymnesium_polylepis.1
MLACEDHIFICLSSNDDQHSPDGNLAQANRLSWQEALQCGRLRRWGATLPTIPTATAGPATTASAQQSPPPRRSFRAATGERK